MNKWLKGLISFLLVSVLSLQVFQPASASVDFKKAKTISFNKNLTGKLTTANGNYEHVYKAKLKKNGNLSITVQTNTKRSWYVEVLTSKGEKMTSFYTTTKSKGNEVREIGLSKGTYYVAISGIYDTAYKMKVNFKSSNYYEREDNDTVKKANGIKFGKNYSGSLEGFTDQDYFKFTVTKKRKVSLTYNNTPKKQRDLLIVNAKGKEYAKIRTDYYVKKPTKSTYTVTLPKGTYYVLIQYGGGSYTFKVAQ
ncbi:hypothetical protein I6J18_15885 [Peribacillus psychrosaccharolyticus]|uniref:Peptidase C-terminal archaeal/bacterial domain-containing protein n=1 Tax=Peribacillus psychrosaccharolyticus TaxID=1407 RepID=A0A974NJY6_PERPY|nr:hypothetical protein [Peribacillus psychrosaccharolyticus]MEC2055432.1 hypothetical protein [Peribacillus psychrosaccharolyticus]MED3743538.1 hypothetical protein [Peribacillus psychrosaccharolyticus]QQS99115.1 hypothetical protein I6J18_15885 [Peribacillus psychrosaccharolyticus]